MNQSDQCIYFKLETHADTQEFVITYANIVVISQESEAKGGFDKGAVGSAW